MHSTNNFVGIIDEDGKRLFGRRLINDKDVVLTTLGRFEKDLRGVVVESTFNWYWLVDALMEKGHGMRPANPAAVRQYSGLKHTDDESDAFWLAEMARLKILPEGYIYPKELRATRDLL